MAFRQTTAASRRGVIMPAVRWAAALTASMKSFKRLSAEVPRPERSANAALECDTECDLMVVGRLQIRAATGLLLRPPYQSIGFGRAEENSTSESSR